MIIILFAFGQRQIREVADVHARDIADKSLFLIELHSDKSLRTQFGHAFLGLFRFLGVLDRLDLSTGPQHLH